MCQQDSRGALQYLQSDLHSVVDHADPHESADFRSLTASLFNGGDGKLFVVVVCCFERIPCRCDWKCVYERAG